MGNRPEQRLKRYAERQGVPAWGMKYQPAIRATPQEAPRISRPSILKSTRVGRDIHLLSISEVNAALIALHHPNLVDLQEQRVLSPTPASHPLEGSPYASGLRFASLPGTVKVAETLGVIAKHPKVFHRFDDADHAWVPLPFVGDLLLFLSDSQGPYCVNWNIKLTQADYLRPGPMPPGRARRRDPDPQAELRHQIEEANYAGAGIRTVRTTGDQIDKHLAANLRDLFGWDGRPHQASIDQQEVIKEIMSAAIGGDTPAYLLIHDAAKIVRLPQYDVLVVVHQAIWRRELLVDLFSPILMSRPFRPQGVDPLHCYAPWFGR